MPQLIYFDTRNQTVRVLLVVAVLLALIWSLFVVRWYLGNMMADYLDLNDSESTAARRAVSLGPSDPLTHWRLGEFTQRRLPPDQMPEAVRQYEIAVSLSPNDYRLWMAFGTSLEQIGEVQRGEQALRRAVALAPSYALPRWYLGNLLLRSGRYDESFVELRQASEANIELRPQIFNLAWEVYSDDFDSLTTAVGVTPEARADFAAYLVGREKVDEGIRLWNTLGSEEKMANRAMGERIVTALIKAQLFHKAIDISNDVVATSGYSAKVGELVNGGFEDEVPRGAGAAFSWQVGSVQAVQVGIDPQRGHLGSRSLRLVFQVRTGIDAIKLSQLVPVLPEQQYELEFYLRTFKLEGTGTPIVEIVDAVNGSVLGVSQPAPNGTTEWHRITFSFKSPPKSEAIEIRINRAPCEDKTLCPIFGNVWYDDFSLKLRN
ncbi:MAG TPA: hypothetical protein VMM84_03130 [Pyrinomonadaceae bacterium]|nr:hypothetical protein [Pyrinomonadaceae bacterium]